MRKAFSQVPGWVFTFIVMLIVVGGFVIAADITQKAGYGVADGKRNTALRDLVVTDVPAMITALNNLDQLASMVVETGTVTNGQTVTFTKTFAVAPKVMVGQSSTNDGAFATSITTTNFAGSGFGAWTNSFIAVYAP